MVPYSLAAKPVLLAQSSLEKLQLSVLPTFLSTHLAKYTSSTRAASHTVPAPSLGHTALLLTQWISTSSASALKVTATWQLTRMATRFRTLLKTLSPKATTAHLVYRAIVSKALTALWHSSKPDFGLLKTAKPPTACGLWLSHSMKPAPMANRSLNIWLL